MKKLTEEDMRFVIDKDQTSPAWRDAILVAFTEDKPTEGKIVSKPGNK